MIEAGHPAVCLLSGGQDSTTSLYWAKDQGFNVTAIMFNYLQRHNLKELGAVNKITELAQVPLVIINLPFLGQISKVSELIDSGDKNPEFRTDPGTGLPKSFVPGRNLIFLSIAAAWAYNNEVHHIVTGVCQTDYSGYPDCREGFVNSLGETLFRAMEKKFIIHTPLMHLTKKDSILLAREVGAFNILAYSHTCYNDKFPPCGECPACIIRAKGFTEAGFEDPLITRARQEGLL